ncbi:unnamed protein product [Discosporangium mesarthrocarpum]
MPSIYVFAQHETADKRRVEVNMSNRLMPVTTLQKEIETVFGVPSSDQRLAFKGKLMRAENEEGKQTTLFDYGINRNDVVQMFPPKSVALKKSAEAAAAAAARAKGANPSTSQPSGSKPMEANGGGSSTSPGPVNKSKDDEEETEPIGAAFLDEAGTLILAGQTSDDPANVATDVPKADGVKCRWARVWLVSEDLWEAQDKAKEEAEKEAEKAVSVTTADGASAGKGEDATCEADGDVAEPGSGPAAESDDRENDDLPGRQLFRPVPGEEEKLAMGKVVTGSKEDGYTIFWVETGQTEKGISVEQVREWLPQQSSRKGRGRGKGKGKGIVASNDYLRNTVILEHNIQGPVSSLPEPKFYKLLYRAPKRKGFKVVAGQAVPKVTQSRIRFDITRGGEGKIRDHLPPGVYTVGLTVLANENACQLCRGNDDVKECKGCGCQACHSTADNDRTLLCDECNLGWHIYCLDGKKHSSKEGNMTEEEIPDGDWYCPSCFNDPDKVIHAKLGKSRATIGNTSTNSTSSGSNKKGRKPTPSEMTTKNWGGGMACVGRTRVCTSVDKHHFGAVPGVRVGSMWQFRMEVSEDGIHRPPVSGMAGTADGGCQSIVLSGGYSDDEDEGEAFLYTGAGGRDLSGNKRTAKQSMDQELSSTNAALAKNCNTKDWKKGKPVRVVRASKLIKTSHGDYAPHIPNGWGQSFRYDGIYKVVKYGPTIGKSGHRVYRYLLRRDDPEAAPWTPKGRKVTPALRSDASNTKNEKPKKKSKQVGADPSVTVETPGVKKAKTEHISFSKEALQADAFLRGAVALDVQNAKKWEEILQAAEKEVPLKDQPDVLSRIEEEFQCMVCMDIASPPVSTPCGHNFCQPCIKRGMKHQEETGGSAACPSCRAAVPEAFAAKAPINPRLQTILRNLFPGS